MWIAASTPSSTPIADELQLTELDAEFPADTFFPSWDRRRFAEVAREQRETEDGLRYAFVTYVRNDAPPHAAATRRPAP